LIMNYVQKAPSIKFPIHQNSYSSTKPRSSGRSNRNNHPDYTERLECH
jgi:hypothetical protein